MDLDSKRLVVVVPNEMSVASRRVYNSDDEAWKNYLENPLIAATKAMMSINGDEDSVAALGMLYDYYKSFHDESLPGSDFEYTCNQCTSRNQPQGKVRGALRARGGRARRYQPGYLGQEDIQRIKELQATMITNEQVPRQIRRPSSGVPPTEPSAAVSNTYGGQDMLDHHCQALRSMPMNLSLNSDATEHPSSKRFAVSVALDNREGDSRGGGCSPFPLVKTESQTSVPVLVSGSSHLEEPREHLRMLYEQNCCNLSLSGCQKDEQSSTPDSTYDDAVEEEIYHRSVSTRVDASRHKLPIDSFKYSLEANMSLRPRQGEGPMAYLNRGQFYALTLSDNGYRSSNCQPRGKTWVTSDGKPSSNEHRASLGGSDLQHDTVVQSVIMVVFGEDKSRDDQLKNWKYWHSRQHTAKQRVLDIADYKESFSTIGNVEEIAYNAVSFTWDVSEEAKVFISVNCLSTDFSSQKGVKGMPLIIQIDTYSYNSCSSRPIHRAFAQIKVFCDKGAERKLRDEEKKQLRRRSKGKNGSSGLSSPIRRAESTLFKSMLDLDSQPVLFIPDVHFGNLQRAGQVFNVSTDEVVMDRRLPKKMSSKDEICPPDSKKPKLEPERKVLLYVRKECDEVFDALMLRAPTLKALMEAISEKYSVPAEKITKVYQKSKKGVLVNMDNNIIQHYSNEDTFILALESSANSFHVTLSEI